MIALLHRELLFGMDAEWYCVYGVVFSTRIVAEGETIGRLLRDYWESCR
jgi:hypothetical protein